MNCTHHYVRLALNRSIPILESIKYAHFVSHKVDGLLRVVGKYLWISAAVYRLPMESISVLKQFIACFSFYLHFYPLTSLRLCNVRR